MTRCMNYDPNQRPFFRAIMRDINKLEEQSKAASRCLTETSQGPGRGWQLGAAGGSHSFLTRFLPSVRSRHCIRKKANN